MPSGVYKRTEEMNKKRSLARKGKPSGREGSHLTRKQKEKISKATKGEKNPNYGKYPSKETRQKMSKAHLGKKYPNRKSAPSRLCLKETKKKISIGNKGKIRSKEMNRKNSEAHKGNHHTEETKQKLRNVRHSKETRRKQSKGIKKALAKFETKKKMKEAHKGEKSHFWKGGISYQPYPFDWTDDLREAIRKRDNYICQLCGIHQDELEEFNKKLDIHHKDYQKDNLNPKNLITLCRNCHAKTNFNRNYWIKYFTRRN